MRRIEGGVEISKKKKKKKNIDVKRGEVKWSDNVLRMERLRKCS
jgi:hypothetical protein